MDILNIIGRTNFLFDKDLLDINEELTNTVKNSSFLVVGGAGSVGQSVCKEIFKRSPKVLHVVDISENNLVELVRDLRSSIGYIGGDFRTFVLDCSSIEFEILMSREGPYDFILNLSALKHVRSEKDSYSLMRMIQVNILNPIRIAKLSKRYGVKKYFCVSTDKAANPISMMGSSKRIMEKFLMRESLTLPISMARFANVAFSDGSLLHGFNKRIEKQQPISAPKDIKRYFITPQESGELCLISCLFGENRDIFFPKLNEELHLLSFPQIVYKYLHSLGFEPFECNNEAEARNNVKNLINKKKWPCYFFASDTSGEKEFEEFYTIDENIDFNVFKNIGIIKNEAKFEGHKLDKFLEEINSYCSKKAWNKTDLVNLFLDIDLSFEHKETGKYLDQKM